MEAVDSFALLSVTSLLPNIPLISNFSLGKREGIVRCEVMGAYRIWCDKIVVFCQIFSYKYCSMGAGAVMMLTPDGISIELHHTNILACHERMCASPIDLQ